MAQMTKLTAGHILAEGLREAGRSAFTTPSLSRRNSTYDCSQARGAPLYQSQATLLTVSTPLPPPRKKQSSSSEDSLASTSTASTGASPGRAANLWDWLPSKNPVINVEEDAETSEEDTRRMKLREQFEGMTYQEIAVWVDTRARLLFPLLFLVFTGIYVLLAEDAEVYQYLADMCSPSL